MTNFYGRFAETASRFPARVAIESATSGGTVTTTYRELVEASVRVAAWLGPVVAAGDRVAILAGNDARWVATYLGILRRGAVAVPLDTAYTAAQVRTILADSGARVLFTNARLAATARQAVEAAGQDGPILVAPGAAIEESVTSPIEIVAAERIDALTEAGDPVEVAPEAAAAILYTSGTTADPKGVVLTHANLDAERQGVLAVIAADETDVVLGVLPLFHALAQMANLILPLTIGARVVFLEQVTSTSLVDALQTRGITILACVPQFYYLIHQRVVATFARRGRLGQRLLRLLIALNARLRDRFGWNPGRLIFARVHRALGPSVRLFITGGSRFDPAIARDLYGLGVHLYNGYGLTETSGAATIQRAGDRFTASVGQPLPGVDVRVGTPDGTDDGEILIRGAVVMREYWRRPEATAAVLSEGWLRTGDLGRVDDAGRVFITGRKKDVIVLSSGKNIYPEEIEAHYLQSRFVKELCVLGVSRLDDPTSERLHAVVVPDEAVMRDRGVVNYRELIRFELEGLSVALPAHKRILSYDIALDALPRTSTGKLRRTQIAREQDGRAETAPVERPVSAGEEAWLEQPAHADLAGAVARHLRRERVNPDDNLELDLGLDSMERVELLTTLEAAAGRRVPAEARTRIVTVRQLVDAVLAGEAAGRTPPHANEAAALPWDTVLAEAPDPSLVGELTRPKSIRAFAIWVGLRAALLATRLVVDLRVRWAAPLPETGACLICPNHQTYLDGFFVAGLLPYRTFRQIFFVGASEYFETPWRAKAARAINIVPVDPDAQLVNAMRAAAAGLSLGRRLMLFPEGERSIDGALKPFRKGAAILASHLDVPIVPVALDGLFPLWPRGRALQWARLVPGRRPVVTVVFGAPLSVARGDYAGGTDALRASVAALIAAPVAGPGASQERMGGTPLL